MDWVTDHPALAWLALALVLGAVEVATLDFVFVMLAGGALAGSLAAAFGAPFAVSAVVAVLSALLLLVLVRPLLARRLRAGSPTLTGTAALVGRDAVVLETVGEHGGRVRLAGEVWSARTADRATTVLPGRTVRVVSIEGATAVVASAPGSESS